MQESPQSPSESLLSESQVWANMPTLGKRLAKALYFSSKCRCIYILLLVYNCVLGVWAAVDLIRNAKPTVTFYVLECGINFVLAIDVLLRLWVKGCYKYWREITNIFEFVVVWLCVIITILSIIGELLKQHNAMIEFEAFEKDFDEVIDIALMLCLCIFQYVRIAFIITKQHQAGVY